MIPPPLTPEKTYFFEKYQFLVRFSVISKSRFFRGLRGSHGFQKIWCGNVVEFVKKRKMSFLKFGVKTY